MMGLDLLDSGEIADEYRYLFTADYLDDREICRAWMQDPEFVGWGPDGGAVAELFG